MTGYAEYADYCGAAKERGDLMKFAKKGDRIVRISDENAKAYEQLGYRVTDKYPAAKAAEKKEKTPPKAEG